MADRAKTHRAHVIMLFSFRAENSGGHTITVVIYRNSDNSLVVKMTEPAWEYLPKGERIEGFV